MIEVNKCRLKSLLTECQKEHFFVSNADLVEFQRHKSMDILECMRNCIDINENRNVVLKDRLSAIFSVWEPELDWKVTSCFKTVECSTSISDLCSVVGLQYITSLVTSVEDIERQILKVQSIVVKQLQYLSLLKCSDIDLMRDLYDRIYLKSDDGVKSRFDEFASYQFDEEFEMLIQKNDVKGDCTDSKLVYVPSNDCLSRIKSLLNHEQLFDTRGQVSSYKKKVLKQLQSFIADDFCATDKRDENAILFSLPIWNPLIFWNYDVRISGVESPCDGGEERLSVKLCFFVCALDELQILIDKLSHIVGCLKIGDCYQQNAINGEKQFLRDLYSETYVYLSDENQRIFEDVVCSRCNVSFLDYSDDYIEDEYFEIIPGRDSHSGYTKRKAMVSEINGECLGKGLFVKKNNYE